MPAATAVKPLETTLVSNPTSNPTTTFLPTSATSLGEAAFAYAELGWAVFPLAPRSKVPLRRSHGYKDATTDPAVIEQWWQKTPDANIGLATGLASNVTVLDVDPRNGGHLSLADLEAEHGRLSDTVESQTGSGGRHVFYQRPDVSIRTGTNALAPGLDIKSDGGYVVLPPSIHPNGQAYEWEASSMPGDVDVAPMPEWMVEALSTPPVPYVHIESTSISTLPSGRVSSRRDLDLALARLLGIDQDVGKKFLCLLHREKDPSAWLFWGKGGDLMYHCTHSGGCTMNIPTLRASLRAGRVVKVSGGRHHHHRVVPLLASGVLKVPLVPYMPLPEDGPQDAKLWYSAFIWTVGFNELSFPGNREVAFSRNFAIAMTGLSVRGEQAAAKWLMRNQYVVATGVYKACGKTCNLLSLGPGPAFDLLDDELEVSDAA